MVLVVIVDDQTFERIAYGFPAFVVLIENVPPIHIAVFVDHQKHLLEIQAEIRVLHIGRQKLPHRVCQPSRGHIPAVRKKRVDLHMDPSRARNLNMTRRELELQPITPPVSASARHLCFAEGAQVERRCLKEIRGFLQRELQFLAAHFAAVRKCGQSACFLRSFGNDGLNLFCFCCKSFLVQRSNSFLLYFLKKTVILKSEKHWEVTQMPYTIEELRRIITPIAQAHGLRSVSLFGSYSKGTARRDSDVDLKIEKGSVMSLFQLSGLRLDIEDALKVPVDLVTNDSSDHEFLDMIAKDEVLLYGYPGN